MKDESRHDARPNGNDRAPPPIRNNAKGENRQRGQQGNFDKCFHRQNMRLPSPIFQPLRLPIKLTHGPSKHRLAACLATIADWLTAPAAAKKAPGLRPGASMIRENREDQYRATTGPPNL